jgi:hypothetical protein
MNLPSGWRRPTTTEATGQWRRKSASGFLVAKADFDGDGKKDVAELLIDEKGKQCALFVRLSSEKGEWQMLGKPLDLADFDRFGIDFVKPGRYKTACGKGYGDYACAHGEPDFLKTLNAAIDFFYTESSDSVFYWDGKARKWVEVLMSD